MVGRLGDLEVTGDLLDALALGEQIVSDSNPCRVADLAGRLNATIDELLGGEITPDYRIGRRRIFGDEPAGSVLPLLDDAEAGMRVYLVSIPRPERASKRLSSTGVPERWLVGVHNDGLSAFGPAHILCARSASVTPVACLHLGRGVTRVRLGGRRVVAVVQEARLLAANDGHPA